MAGKKTKASASPADLRFHFTTMARYLAILDGKAIETFANASIGGRPGISFTDLDPRTVAWQTISMQNWKSLRRWQMEAYVAVPKNLIKRPKRLPAPQNHEWVTTSRVRLGPGCFGGIHKAAGTYDLDPRPGT